MKTSEEKHKKNHCVLCISIVYRNVSARAQALTRQPDGTWTSGDRLRRFGRPSAKSLKGFEVPSKLRSKPFAVLHPSL